ncbi:MAG: hypothetical protein HUJ93_02335, partial [Bacteroidales bacterium]|nr:hypothetical protein [Bacteroidales bacterium]
LQDKSATDLMGMLSAGYSVGEWTKNIHILESHIIGDPTFRFSCKDERPVDLHNAESSYWLSVLSNQNLLPDVQSVALYKLFAMKYPQMSQLLLNTFRSSPWYTQRLQCMHLLEYYNDGNYCKLLAEAIDDPYEFIRRRSAFFMGMTGRNSFVPYLVDAYLEDYMAKRVMFNIQRSFDLLSIPYLRRTMAEAIENSDFIFDKEAFAKVFEQAIQSSESSQGGVYKALCEGSGLFYINSMRNRPLAMAVPEILTALDNDEFTLETKVSLAEVLGWFKYAYNKDLIIAGLEQRLNKGNLDPVLHDEMVKTVGRLKEYMR